MKSLIKYTLVTVMLLICAPTWATGKSLNFEWEQAIGIEFTGWKLYMSETSGSYDYNAPFATILYDGNPTGTYTTEQTVTVPSGNTVTKYFVLRAYNDTGPSDDSNEVSQMIDMTVPSVPFSLTVEITVTP